MTVIIRRILLSMITRREDSHLMSVNRIVVEKVSRFLIDLARAQLVTPHVQQLLVHRVRAKFGDLAQVAKGRQFGVCHAHVGFVGLHVCGCDGLEFCRGCCVEEFVQHGDREVVA